MKIKLLLFVCSVVISVNAFAGRECRFISTSGKIEMVHASRDDVQNVLIFMAESEVPAGAKRLGIILNGAKKQSDAMIQSQKLAARYGATGILLLSGREINGQEKIANAFLLPGAYKSKWVFYVYKIESGN